MTTYDQQHPDLWGRLVSSTASDGIFCTALRYVAHNITDMTGRPFQVDCPRIRTAPLGELSLYAEDPEAETVGIYLVSDDDLPGQAIITLALDDAHYLADWLLEMRPGSTSRLGPLERSLLAELGNVTLSAFLNVAAELSGRPLRPSPPAVMVDMLATVMQVAATAAGSVTDEVVVLEADFLNQDSQVLLRLWLLPDPLALSIAQVAQVRVNCE